MTTSADRPPPAVRVARHVLILGERHRGNPWPGTPGQDSGRGHTGCRANLRCTRSATPPYPRIGRRRVLGGLINGYRMAA